MCRRWQTVAVCGKPDYKGTNACKGPFALFSAQRNPDGDCYAAESAGMKRSRSGQPISRTGGFLNHVPQLPSDNTSPRTSDDLSSSNSRSDSDLTSEDDEDSNGDEYTLESHHETQQFLPDLIEFSRQKICTCMASARYVVPPNNRLPPRKRAKTASSRPPQTCFEDSESDRKVMLSRVDGYFHLACPIYASNPEKYHECLQQHDFLCVEEVMSHLQRHHAEPPYCPTCWQTFDTTTDRDRHIRSMTCKFHSKLNIDGINESKLAEIKNRDRLYFSERRRWLRIWNTIFPAAKPPSSPYLEHGVEQTVCMTRDYWARYGKEWVSEYMDQRQLGDDSTLQAVCRMVLRHLLHNLLTK
ncbi:hypothetical protein QQX98_004374 [Neonectria punicea]|uniref:C2H2-type domain-containing protein n=1 Tax=Neonectria punicea TaxID=979145 RepID=A0ABR1H996_9HYPO